MERKFPPLRAYPWVEAKMASITTKESFVITVHGKRFEIPPSYSLTANPTRPGDDGFIVQIDTLEEANRFEKAANNLSLTWSETTDFDDQELTHLEVDEWIESL